MNPIEMSILQKQLEDLRTDLQEDRYVIRRNSADIAEIKDLLHKHIGEEAMCFHEIHAKIEIMAKNNEIITEYVNKMQVGAWVMHRIKIIVLWFAAIGGSFIALYEWLTRYQN